MKEKEEEFYSKYVEGKENDIKFSEEKEELISRYDSRASFYKKAYIIYYKNNIYLQSYNTVVAMIENDNVHVFGWYSQTTARHINEFLKQFGFNTMTKKEMTGIK